MIGKVIVRQPTFAKVSVGGLLSTQMVQTREAKDAKLDWLAFKIGDYF